MNNFDTESVARTTSSWREVLSKSSSEFTTVIVPVFLSIANDAEDPSDGRENDRSPGCVRAITEVTLWPFRADSAHVPLSHNIL